MPKKPASSKAAAPAVRPQRGVVTITRQVHFNSAHRLWNPSKSQAWNEKQFGLCTNPHWHGHNYVLEVSLRGEPDPETGCIMDLGKLKEILHAHVVDKCDHRNLNDQVDFLRGIIPSTENSARTPAVSRQPAPKRRARVELNLPACSILGRNPASFVLYCR